MYHVELSQAEMEILSQVVQSSLVTLELEIQHTDHQDFKNLLKNRRETLRTMIAKLRQPMAVAA
jgi:hypothetical protein